ncbi:hypothetical protein ACRDNQ_16465 [Palleronia sp. KMU-117]|uniref:hypothetical protein n=1 Tax=Palleronia sp. KMU-117 TaxID=3434108 RepID=UPI003D74AA60
MGEDDTEHPGDHPPDRPALSDPQRAELRGRIRDLLASRSLAEKVRRNLTSRAVEQGDDTAFDGDDVDLPDRIQSFFRQSNESLVSFPRSPAHGREMQPCSKH